MARVYFSKFGFYFVAIDVFVFHNPALVRTAGAEVATLGWIGRAGHIAL